MSLTKTERAARGRPASARRRVAACLALILAAAALPGCGGLSSASGGGRRTLVVANWKGYGSDQPWATQQFEKETGAKVVHRYVSSEAEMVQLLRSSKGIDVALPNFQFIGPAIREHLIQPLDESRLTSWKAVFPQLSQQDAFHSGGRLYGVPWVWGYSSVFYNTKAVNAAPTSVSALWDPRNKGKVAMVDDATLNVLLAAMYLREDPAHPDLAKVKRALLKLKANAGLVTASPDELAKAIASKTVTIGYVASSYVGGFRADHLPVGFTVPHEGAVGWGDTWTIAAGTKQKDLAYKWVNFMTSAGFEKRWASDPAAGSPAPANAEAVKALSETNRKRLQADPANLGKLTMQGPLPDKQLSAWLKLWDQVKGS